LASSFRARDQGVLDAEGLKCGSKAELVVQKALMGAASASVRVTSIVESGVPGAIMGLIPGSASRLVLVVDAVADLVSQDDLFGQLARNDAVSIFTDTRE